MSWLIVSLWLARVILALLVFLSFWSVAIMLERRRFFKSLEPFPDLDTARNGEEKSDPIFQDCVKRLGNENNGAVIERNFESYVAAMKPKLEKGLPVLGTLGGIAPFIGLLGTVLGIIKAFGDLSINSQDTNAVMFALAEALILTAVGLAVAIPAVVAFNYFNRKVRAVINHCGILRNEILNEKQKAA